MKKFELYLVLAICLILITTASAWWRRRRRRRCDTSPCSWAWGQCSATCGGGTQSPVVTKPQGPCGSCSLPVTKPCNTNCCPIKCVWASWGSWGACSATCGDAIRLRFRKYAQASKCRGSLCPGSSIQTSRCSQKCCPVDCIWGPWGGFGYCSASCGGGQHSRSRSAKEKATCGGVECFGSNTDVQECNTHCCPVDCQWGEWTPFTECSTTCGKGTQTRYRKVTVSASCAGKSCTDTDSESHICNDVCCPVDCVWTAWSEYGVCSVTCGGGFQTRIRSVSESEVCGGKCNGEASESKKCNVICCPVDCKWESWSDFDSCSASCGGGTQTRRRSISVTASCGGESCDGSDVNLRVCNDICCPVDCVWSSWNGFGECSVTCGSGTRTRTRDILVPSSCNGMECTGLISQDISCNTQCCAIDCMWGTWGQFTPCSASCSCGDRLRSRVIAIPESCGGAPCNGSSQEIQSCNTNCCPVDCVWGPWGEFGSCSVTCGAGNHTRYRQHVVSARCGGESCHGPSADTMPCNNNCCPIDCVIEKWGKFGSCSVTCGGGVQFRTRNIEVRPTGGGQSCSELLVETTICNDHPCPVDCVWSDWSVWSECSLSCGGGDQQRNRTVLVYEENSGDLCKEPSTELRTCNDNCCSVDCEWQEWLDWSSCSKTCDRGVQTRQRSHKTTSACGGRECVGEFLERRSCKEMCCPVDCRWSEWTEYDRCSKPCGGGSQSRYRRVAVEAYCGGTPCVGKEVETYSCNDQCCTVDCEVSFWSSWSECSHSCGGRGISVRSRKIFTYPKCNGSSCDKKLIETRPCNQFCFNDGIFVGSECACADGWQGECCDVGYCEMTSWSSWSECSATCGANGTSTRHREHLSLSNCTLSCHVPNTAETKSCNQKCFNGGELRNGSCQCVGGWAGECCNIGNEATWTEWSKWTSCPVSCGRGDETRTRTCRNGDTCPGESKQSRTCTVAQVCPCVCPETRTCYDRFPDYCRDHVSISTCGQNPWLRGNCARKCQFCSSCNPCGTWESWTIQPKCNVPCGHGERKRTRVCPSGFTCNGKTTDTIPCNLEPCGLPWLDWGPWSPCTQDCNTGKNIRSRECSVPDQNACGDPSGRTETASCNVQSCEETWFPWGNWKSCSASCGPGVQRRERRCRGPSCVGQSFTTRGCNLKNCQITTSWSACSRSCGQGTRTRMRCTSLSSCALVYEDCDDRSCANAQCDFPLRTRYGMRSHECCDSLDLTQNSCGVNRRRGRIIQGRDADIDQWPWMVYIRVGGNLCGGALLTSRMVLTAAHCLEGSTPGSFKILLGALRPTDRSNSVQVKSVKRLFSHPRYNFPTNDIAIIEMSEPTDLSTSSVRTICLPRGETFPNDVACIAAGWGLTRPSNQPGESLAGTLQEVDLRTLPFGICRSGYANDNTVNHAMNENTMICAGAIQGGVDTCNGDSGGPLMCQRCENCAWVVAGVTSFGDTNCGVARKPGVYTRVSAYSDFVNDVQRQVIQGLTPEEQRNEERQIATGSFESCT